MTRRNPWPVWLLVLALLAIALAASRCWAPVVGPSTPATPSPTYALVVTVLPSSTAAPGAAPTVQPSPTVPERLLLTPSSTPVPPTETPLPTPTPTIAPPAPAETRVPVQRG